MRNFLNVALAFGLIISTTGVLNAQSAGRERSAVQTNGTVETSAASGAKAAATADELIATLPASDLIAVVDANRAFNELLPRLADISTLGLDKLAKSIRDFTQKTGIDPSKIRNAAIGVIAESVEGSGALAIRGKGVVLLQGIDPDAKQIEAAMKEFGSEIKTSDYKGKTIYSVASKANAPSAGPLSLKTDEVALVALGGERVALGDLNVVKQVIDIQTGSSKGGVSAAMTGALAETRSSALVRFALNVPEKLRAEAANQGDLFKSIATIKIILGAFDVADDLGLSLDMLIRTASQNDATELENGLKGLIDLVRSVFGGGDPKTNLVAQALDQVKIASKANDVSFALSLPRALLDQLIKKEQPPPAEKKR